MSYLEGHIKSGFKVGDIVNVTRMAISHEQGWDNSWNNDMDKFIGKTGTIVEDKKVKDLEWNL